MDGVAASLQISFLPLEPAQVAQLWLYTNQLSAMSPRGFSRVNKSAAATRTVAPSNPQLSLDENEHQFPLMLNMPKHEPLPRGLHICQSKGATPSTQRKTAARKFFPRQSNQRRNRYFAQKLKKGHFRRSLWAKLHREKSPWTPFSFPEDEDCHTRTKEIRSVRISYALSLCPNMNRLHLLCIT